MSSQRSHVLELGVVNELRIGPESALALLGPAALKGCLGQDIEKEPRRLRLTLKHIHVGQSHEHVRQITVQLEGFACHALGTIDLPHLEEQVTRDHALAVIKALMDGEPEVVALFLGIGEHLVRQAARRGKRAVDMGNGGRIVRPRGAALP